MSFELQFIERAHATGDTAPFDDEEFGSNDRSLFRDPSLVPLYAQKEGGRATSWRRPQEWTESPVLFREGPTLGDVMQGSLPDLWLLGAMACVASHPTLDLVGSLVVSNEADFLEYGIITFRFYKEGEWVEVPVDTRVPFAGEMPLYSRSADPSEVWVPLLEKAYAKLHGSYEALAEGDLCEALTDLTGGVTTAVDLTDDAATAAIDGGLLWKKVCRYVKWGYLLSCCMEMAGGDAEEEETEKGVLQNHAYSVIYYKEIKGLKFLKVGPLPSPPLHPPPPSPPLTPIPDPEPVGPRRVDRRLVRLVAQVGRQPGGGACDDGRRAGRV